MGCSSCHQPTPEWGLLRLKLPSGHIYLLQCEGLQSLQGEDLLHCNPPRGCRGQPASPWSSPRLQESLCSGTQSTSCPSFLRDTHLSVLQGCFSHTFLLLTLTDATQHFLPNMLSQISTHMVDGLSFGQCRAHFGAG